MNDITFFTKKKLPKPTAVYDTYWKFAVERQKIFFRRIENEQNWTADDILKTYKFTNAYRASDRVSQFLIQNVIYKKEYNAFDTLFRILLFKTFNKIETWQYLEAEFGEMIWKNFSFERYNKALNEVLESGNTIYSGAYIMTSGKSKFGHSRKHQNHLKLIEFMVQDNLLQKINECPSLKALFQLLKSYPTIGNFLAYQYAIDINYSEICDFNEMDFVQPGPGALDGIKKCFSDFGDYSEMELIEFVTDQQEREFARLGLDFQNLWGRRLQLIDCQNLFCEVDKYARVAHPEFTGNSGRKRIKQKFTPKKESFTYWYPPKWGINQNIKQHEKKECIY